MRVRAFVALATACVLAAGGGRATFARHVMAATDVATRKAAEVGQAGALPPLRPSRLHPVDTPSRRPHEARVPHVGLRRVPDY